MFLFFQDAYIINIVYVPVCDSIDIGKRMK